MDKVVDHILVFNGQGDIRDFPGNYTQYRAWKEEKERHDREQVKAVQPVVQKAERPRQNDKRRLSFKEKREFEQLGQEIEALEAEKKQLEADLCSGTLSVDALTEKSKRLPLLEAELDEKSFRWLELSEIEG
jgi:ATP-binding cassette subfamily F protein uup